jgi:hypothetical protein
MMTSGTTASLAISAINIKAQSCVIAGPAWLGLAASADSNVAWTVTPAASGSAPLVTACRDGRNATVTAYDTLRVFNAPTVTPDISGTLPVNIGDSADVSYDSAYTHTLDVTCQNCGTSANTARVAANTIRFYALQMPSDTLHRGICFTTHGMDGRFTQQQCVNVKIMHREAALYVIPAAIRSAEVVALHTIPVATYDNTGQSNHPDFMRVPAAWSAGQCWLTFTPYAGSNGQVENPSLASSPDCEHWAPAPGVTAPLVALPPNGYNSDPELMYDPARGCLGVVFRQVTSVNGILITSSCNGTMWSVPRPLFSAPNHSAVSPSVSTGPDGFSRIWYVDAGPSGCTSQSNVIKMRTAVSSTAGLDSVQFAPEIATDLALPGWVIWHIKVRYIPEKNEYWAMYAAFPRTTGIGNCLADDLFMAVSKDGVHWQSFPAPVLNHLDARFNFTSLYRGSFLYDAATDELRTIVSGIEVNWGQYGVLYNYTALRTALNSSLTAPAAALLAPPSLVRPAEKVVRMVHGEDQP